MRAATRSLTPIRPGQAARRAGANGQARGSDPGHSGAGGQAGGQAGERAGGHAGHGQARARGAVRGQNASDNGRAALELDGWVARESEHEVAGVLLVQAGSRGATQSAAALSIHAVAAVPPRDIEMLAQELSQGGRCRLHIVHKDKTVPVRDDDVDGVVLLHAKPKILL